MKKQWILQSLGLSLMCFSTVTKAAETKPNIVFIFSDDQSYETIRAAGKLDIDTPNLDRLTSKGTTFDHAYNMGSWAGAVCIASRTCLNTGAFLWRAEAALKEVKAGNKKLWSQHMESAGYETYISGKWHVPISATNHFHVSRNVRAGMPKAKTSGYNRPIEGEEMKWLPWDTENGGFWQGGQHWSEALADDSVSFIEQASKSEKPYFMYLAFNAPHDPRQAPKEYVDMYPLNRVALPKTYQSEYPEMNTGVPMIRDEKLAPYPRTEYAVKVNRQEYFAAVTHMDAQIGRILDAVENSKNADNTWIIFTSDHGLAVGHHGLMGKQNMYEHSLRVPFIIAGPGVKSGETNSTPIYLQDVMPTTLEIGGQEIPNDVNYKSLLPLLSGKRKQQYDAIYGAYMGTQRAIVHQGWKLIVYPELSKYKVFNLKEDPEESVNLADNPEYTKKLAQLTEMLNTKMKQLGDPMTSLKAANFPVRKKGKGH